MKEWWRRIPLGKRYSLGWAVIFVAIVLNLLLDRVFRPAYYWLEAHIGAAAAWLALAAVIVLFAPVASIVAQLFLPVDRLAKTPEEDSGST